MIQETFLPRLFFGNTKYLSPIVGVISTIPAEKSGLELLNPVTSAKEKDLNSQWGSVELIRDVTGVVAFSNATTFWLLGNKCGTVRKNGMTQTTPHSRVYL